MIERLYVSTNGQGLYDITTAVTTRLKDRMQGNGLCTFFLRHTSCSLLIQENADPTARVDLENWMNRLVVEGDPLYTHTTEGVDDMPAHIKAMLTATQLSVPYENAGLLLGTWQGIFLWEHRHRSHQRELIIHH